MIESYEHIIWDWNGTIFNDVELCCEIINHVLTKRSYKTLTLQEYRRIFTFPVKDYYERAGFDFNKYPFEEVGTEWMKEYESRKNECSLHNGVTETLNTISGSGIGQSVLSAYSQHTLIDIISHFGLKDFFSHIVGLDNIYATSKVELGKELVKELNLNGKALLIGDTVHDYDVSVEMGVDCVLIANGHQCKEKLLECNVPVLDSVTQLLNSK